MSEPKLTMGDKRLLIRAMRTFDIKALYIKHSKSKKKYPDIWVQLGGVPVITVTAEWARQKPDERGKRLVHECLHIIGYDHNEKIGYSTYPDKDTFSKRVYEAIK